ncbi:hypothetical protein TNCV_27711 [Trichonephila clavipes]|uniref:Uncharacterized protein n=1 Tax=Trichonephila clavipes TaxID=2585209 RepID=A0A8X6WMR6_TRICX|nr:hypothetical protein TNCV_27711 [Trichonephila clavipes]
MRKDHLTIEISSYRTSVENLESSSPVQHNVSPADNSRNTVMDSFCDAVMMKPCPDLFPNQMALGIVCDTQMTLSHTKSTTSLLRFPVLGLLTPL